MKILAASLLVASPCWAFAQAGDPLKSPACGQALAALDAARAADPRGAQVAALRSEAAQACLGGGDAPSRSARVLQAPIAVPPPAVTPAAPREPLAQPHLPPPPVAITRPAAPALCDAGGCWSDDGSGLRHLGPNLIGPRGPCVQQGGQVACP